MALIFLAVAEDLLKSFYFSFEQRKQRELTRIRHEIKQIHDKSFKSMVIDELLPCCGPVYSASEQTKMFEFDELEKLVAQRRAAIYCSDYAQYISVRALLKNIAPEMEVSHVKSSAQDRIE